LVPFGKDQSVVEYKKAGIQVDLLPVLLTDNGQIRLEIRPRISTIDDAGAVEVAGHRIPRLRTREVDVGVDARVGQTVILACLAQEPAASKTVRQAGMAADDKTEHDLIFLVTPTLVSGDAPKNAPPTSTAIKPDESWWDRLWR
jgi:Flp pilus assembly secretin CpaC